MSEIELNWHTRKLANGKATVTSEISCELLKTLKLETLGMFCPLLNSILNTKHCLTQWKKKVKLVCKGTGKDIRKLDPCRLICILSNIYKLLMSILKDSLWMVWMQQHPLQNPEQLQKMVRRQRQYLHAGQNHGDSDGFQVWAPSGVVGPRENTWQGDAPDTIYQTPLTSCWRPIWIAWACTV